MEGKGKELAIGPSLSNESSVVDSHSYYLARRTTMEMLRDRGYEVSDEDINLSLQEFRAIYGGRLDVDRLRISTQHRSDSSKKVNGFGFLRFLSLHVEFSGSSVFLKQ